MLVLSQLHPDQFLALPHFILLRCVYTFFLLGNTDVMLTEAAGNNDVFYDINHETIPFMFQRVLELKGIRM